MSAPILAGMQTEKVAGRRARSSRPPARPGTRPAASSSPMALVPWIALVVLTIAALSGGYYLFQKYSIAQADLDEARRTSAEAQQRAASADSKVMTLEPELSEARGEFPAVRRRSVNKSMAALADKLKALLGDGIGEVVAGAGGRLNLGLTESTLFTPGTSELSRDGEEVLDRIAAALGEFPDEQIWVYGHGAGQGERPSTTRWQASAQRALAVVFYLQNRAEIAPERLAAVAFGAPRSGPRRGDRGGPRVELVLFPRDAR